MDIGGIKLAAPAHLALVTILPEQVLDPSVVILVETIRSDLEDLDSGWTWVVQERSSAEF